MKVKIIILSSVFFSTAVLAEEQNIGQENEAMESHLLFLQDTTVLLKKGNQRFSIGLNIINDEQRALFNNISQQTLSLNFDYSLGLKKGTELFFSLPLNQTKTQNRDFLKKDNTKQKISKVGNVSLGVKHTFFNQTATRPEWTGNFSASLPTDGGNTNQGSGSIGITVIKTVDPVVLYSSLNYSLDFSSNNPIWSGQLGTAFAVNHKVAFGGSINVSLAENENSLSLPAVLSLRTIYTINKKHSFEPNLGIGLTESSPDFSLSISYSWRNK